MKKFLILIFILSIQPAFSEITFEKKKLFVNYNCGGFEFGMENTVNSKNDRVTVWAQFNDKSEYSLPISIVAGSGDENYKMISQGRA